MSYREEQLERLPARIQAFIEQFSTAQLSTVDDKGIPLASYGPFVRQGNDFIMLLSTVSKHARNLQCHPKASLMLVEPEDKARHLFARERLVIVEQLCGMKDFSFYRFVPKSGNYVKGFGQAFRLDHHMQQAIHLTEGHTEETPA